MNKPSFRCCVAALLTAVALVAACGDDGDSNGGGGGGRGTFLSAGDFGVPMVSTDGVNWTLASADVPLGDNWSLATDGRIGVTSGPNDTVAGGQISRFSAFPEGFESVSAPFLRVLTHGSGRFVGIEDGGRVYTSTDGLTFVLAQTLATMALAYEVEFGEGVFVAVGTSNVVDGPDVAYRSVDGLSWSEVLLPDASTGDTVLFDVTFADGMFHVVGTADGGVNSLWSSSNGLDWTRQPMGGDETSSPRVVAGGSGRIVALSSGRNEASVYRWVSMDEGASWDLAPAFTQSDMEDIEFGRGIYVAVSSQGAVAVSTDGGESWTLNSPNNGSLRDVAYRP